MIKDRDFIFTGLQPWDIAIGSNAKDIALEVAKHNRVLYINAPLDKKSAHLTDNSPETIQRKKVISKQAPALRQISLNFWVLDYPFTVWPINFLPDGSLFDMVNRMNSRKMFSFVKKVIQQLQFSNYLLFIDNDIYRSFYAPDFLAPSYSIYYRRDNMTSAYWKNHAPRLEPLLCTKCDLVVSNSIQLADAVKSANNNTFDVGQGVDLSDYDHTCSYASPDYVKNVGKPIIGYVGWITSRRLDADLLQAVAAQRPQYSFVMVGKEDAYFQEHTIHQLPNVHFLGEKKFSEVAQYMASFDVCINPQLINEATIGNYPRKIDEYLALGKPVVATRTATMELFDEYVWNCNNVEEYVKAIDEAVGNHDADTIESRIRFAHSHTWENSVNKIYSHIQAHLNVR